MRRSRNRSTPAPSSALRQADPHARARSLLRLQRLHGNAAVQRVIRSLQVTDAGRDARVQAIGERAGEAVPSDRLEKAALYREAVAAELDASPAASKTERELVQDNVNTVGQIFSNYQAALHLFEEAVTSGYGETVPRELALEVLQEAAHEVFEPVLDACVGRRARPRRPGGGEHRAASTTYPRSRSSRPPRARRRTRCATS